MLRQVFNKAAMLAIGVGLLIAGGTPGYAYMDCEKSIHKAEKNLERAIQRHGLHSVQAEKRRDQLERVRARCSR